MGKIKVLPPEVYSQIKAGEVIERPASIISELIDNSIDAGSKEIIIKIEEGGLKKITVIDNGSGIEKDDLPLAFAMHSTSKISKPEDLFDIITMGFRGEALYSIQSIAKISIASNCNDGKKGEGWRIKSFGEDAFKVNAAACIKGTKIDVEDIFFNTPVRKKFLKSIYTEWNNIKKVSVLKAFSNQQISFKLFHNNEFVFSTNGDEDFKKNFFSIYNNENNFEIYNYKKIINERLSIELFFSDEEVFFSNRKYQTFFVNKRPVTANFFYPAIESGYRSYISPGRYPLIYSYLDISPEDIDVNIHPAKKEIKFLNQELIFAGLQKTIAEAYNKIVKNKYFIPDNNIDISGSGLKIKKENKDFSNEYFNDVVFKQSNDSFFKSNSTVLDDYNIIGTIFDTYIIVEKDNKVIFIDQHAACEAVIYKNKKEKLELEHSSETLVIPIAFEADKTDKKILGKINILNKNYFKIEESAGSSFLIREVPSAILNNKDYSEVQDIVADFLVNSQTENIDIIDNILITASCREAVKKGDRLSMIELAEIVDEYFKKNITNCPHGRPVSFEFDRGYFDKIFQRKK